MNAFWFVNNMKKVYGNVYLFVRKSNGCNLCDIVANVLPIQTQSILSKNKQHFKSQINRQNIVIHQLFVWFHHCYCTITVKRQYKTSNLNSTQYTLRSFELGVSSTSTSVSIHFRPFLNTYVDLTKLKAPNRIDARRLIPEYEDSQ